MNTTITPKTYTTITFTDGSEADIVTFEDGTFAVLVPTETGYFRTSDPAKRWNEVEEAYTHTASTMDEAMEIVAEYEEIIQSV